MVMWFNVKEARDFLLRHGYVFTLRPKAPRGPWKRLRGFDVLMYQGFGKKGRVFYCWLDTVYHAENLVSYYENSGFESPEDWLVAAGDNRELYLVVLIEHH